MAHGDVYSTHFDNQTLSAATPLLEVTAGSTHGLEILRAWVGQDSKASSGQEEITMCSFSSGGTGGSSG